MIIERTTHKTINDFDVIETHEEAKIVFVTLVHDINQFLNEQN